jgi:hypothetical protein
MPSRSPVLTMTARYALPVVTVQRARRVVSRIRRVSAYFRLNLNLRPPVWGTENTAAIARFGAPMPLDWSTLPPCPACNGYGTADGHPAPTTTAAALLVEGCAACGGTGDAVEVGS